MKNNLFFLGDSGYLGDFFRTISLIILLFRMKHPTKTLQLSLTFQKSNSDIVDRSTFIGIKPALYFLPKASTTHCPMPIFIAPITIPFIKTPCLYLLVHRNFTTVFKKVRNIAIIYAILGAFLERVKEISISMRLLLKL